MSEAIRVDRTTNPQCRNLIVCSDGTGNAGGRSRPTNVWRIFNLIERRESPVEQIAYYDDGVGTEEVKPLKLLGGAFGCGFTRNLIDLYSFLALNYRPGDRIFLFGFSRGAFTVRTLAGIIVKCGLIDRKHFLAEREPRKLVKQVIRAYRAVEAKSKPDLGAELAKLKGEESDAPVEWQQDVKIHFVGVFDTVDAVGVPIDGAQKYVNWLTERVLARKLYDFGDRDLNKQVVHGCQALSIDDERKTFHPNVWNDREAGRDAQTGDVWTQVEQVWFAGSHSNVGGGYPKDGMALVPLEWMMEKAVDYGLYFSPQALEGRLEASFGTALDPAIRVEYDAVAREITKADVHAKLYNPRKGLGIFYRYTPRSLPDGAKVHVSVYERIRRGTERYAPLTIPTDAQAVPSQNGPYSQMPENSLPDLAKHEIRQIEKLAETRTLLYGISMGTAVCVGLAALTALLILDLEPATFWLYRVLGWVLPDRLVDLMGAFPAPTLALVVLFGGLYLTRRMLRQSIHAAAFRSWRRALAEVGLEEAPLDLATLQERSRQTDSRSERLHRAYVGWRVACWAVSTAALLAFGVMTWDASQPIAESGSGEVDVVTESSPTL